MIQHIPDTAPIHKDWGVHSEVMTPDERQRILDHHRQYDVNHIAYLMDYRFHAGDINQVLRERIAQLENV